MSEFIKVAKITDIAEGKGLCVEVNGKKVGLFNLGGEVFAIDDICTHAHASLSDA
ncbi:MAG: nitrite reductase (NAD(P)H) small subunit, partial [Planctomycetes bacterium]|nr:nitrite reductase (NAD(P)H) small subunit [Planctomycetota bacterium]